MEITKLEQLQNNFKLALEKSLNQKHTIDTEIKEVEDFINTIPIQRAFRKPIKAEFKTLRTTRVFNLNPCDRQLLSDAFYSITETGDFNDLSRTVNDTDLTYQHRTNTVKQAFELFEYYKWLNKLLTVPQKEEKKSDGLSHKERMLALYYLGLDMRKFGNNLQSAKILSKIIGFDESNTKKFLTYFDGKECEVKKEPNITKMLELFEHQDFKEIHNAVRKDLEK